MPDLRVLVMASHASFFFDMRTDIWRFFQELKAVNLVSKSGETLAEAIRPIEFNLEVLEISEKPNQDTIDEFKQYLKVNELKEGLFFYWLCVRIIRLADQKASSKLGSLQ